jgi:hypothetical protein
VTVLSLEYLTFGRDMACEPSEDFEGVGGLTARGGTYHRRHSVQIRLACKA